MVKVHLVYLFTQVQNLSGGELQRVALTICLGKVGTFSSSVVWEIPAIRKFARQIGANFFYGAIPFFYSFNNKRLLLRPLDGNRQILSIFRVHVRLMILCSAPRFFFLGVALASLKRISITQLVD